MLEASGLSGNPAAAAAGGGATITTADVGCGSVPGVFVGEQEGDRNLSGNRWPREETLALLKIRSDMDVAFRDSSLKAPLWDEVSRKLGELGYHRGGKKCKEKFENIYKYHKRTKECRSGRQNGKNYRFFEQLELLDDQSSLPSPSQRKIQSSLDEKTVEMEREREREKETTAMTMTDMTIQSSIVAQDFTIPSSFPNSSAEFMFSTSTSTTSSSGRESEGNDKKKRKLGDYFDRLMKEVLQKQENLQNKFMEALDKCEKDRLARDEAWKVQQLARMKREQDMLAQERAISAAKDAAVIAFLQKISDQQCPVQLPENLIPIPTPNPVSVPTPTPAPAPAPAPAPTPIPIMAEKVIDKQENEVGENSAQASSSRWPKMEIEALISLKTNLDLQYQDNGPKGPLWEEISLSMKNIGYNRSAKRCKEKWENINKYYKRVKESNKKRNEASKTCPYFELLESIHERKYRKVSDLCKPEDILMQMVGKAQEPQPLQQRPGSVIEDGQSENVDQNQEDDEVDDDEEDDNGDDYQIVANNPSSNSIME